MKSSIMSYIETAFYLHIYIFNIRGSENVILKVIHFQGRLIIIIKLFGYLMLTAGPQTYEQDVSG